jgi:hypothetical protein
MVVIAKDPTPHMVTGFCSGLEEVADWRPYREWSLIFARDVKVSKTRNKRVRRLRWPPVKNFQVTVFW